MTVSLLLECVTDKPYHEPHAGFEPATSSLQGKHSSQTELMWRTTCAPNPGTDPGLRALTGQCATFTLIGIT